MKRILVSLTLFVIAFVVVTGGLALMAEQHPFRPGQGPYAAQNMAEQINCASPSAPRARLMPRWTWPTGGWPTFPPPPPRAPPKQPSLL